VLAGYPDDLGIRMNNGRPGAMEAPKKIRHFLNKFTPPVSRSSPKSIWDCGDLNISALSASTDSRSLELRHEAAREQALRVFNAGGRLISLGGGHDYGFSDGAAFLQTFSSTHLRPLVINIDAHLDVRPASGPHHSGTPFRRLLESEFEFDLLQIGIQQQCNAQSHLNYCLERGVHVLHMEDILSNPAGERATLIEFTEPHLRRFPNRPTFLSLDIDGFSSSFAPGASQSWPTGITVAGFLPFLNHLLRSVDVRSVGIYEVSPPLDVADQTSKLAAVIVHNILFSDKL